MAITIQYGPIGAALGLARQAGLGQRQQVGFGQDMQFLNYVQDAQSALDRRHANAIQNALASRELDNNANATSERLHQDAQRQAAEEDFRNRQLAANVTDQNADRNISQQNANTSAKNAESEAAYRKQQTDLAGNKFSTQQDALDSLPPDVANMIRANGHLPAQNQQDNQRLMEAEWRRLDASLRQAQKDLQTSAYDEADPKKLLAEQSSTLPQAIKGREQSFNDATERIKALANQKKAIEDALQQKNQSVINPGATNTVDPNVIKQISQQNAAAQPAPTQAPQSAPDQQPRIVRIAVNPQTGKRIGLTDTGQLVPLN